MIDASHGRSRGWVPLGVRWRPSINCSLTFQVDTDFEASPMLSREALVPGRSWLSIFIHMFSHTPPNMLLAMPWGRARSKHHARVYQKAKRLMVMIRHDGAAESERLPTGPQPASILPCQSHSKVPSSPGPSDH